jgi:hypothetical protein
MKTLALTLFFAVASAGCLGTFIPDPQPAGTPDMAGGGTGTGGNGTGTGGGNMNGGGGGDMAGGTAPAGTKLFGDLCTVNGDCSSAICGQFVMGTVHRCSKPCTVATQTSDCPAPSDGTCNNNGYCKFDQ